MTTASPFVRLPISVSYRPRSGALIDASIGPTLRTTEPGRCYALTFAPANAPPAPPDPTATLAGRRSCGHEGDRSAAGPSAMRQRDRHQSVTNMQTRAQPPRMTKLLRTCCTYVLGAPLKQSLGCCLCLYRARLMLRARLRDGERAAPEPGGLPSCEGAAHVATMASAPPPGQAVGRAAVSVCLGIIKVEAATLRSSEGHETMDPHVLPYERCLPRCFRLLCATAGRAGLLSPTSTVGNASHGHNTTQLPLNFFSRRRTHRRPPASRGRCRGGGRRHCRHDRRGAAGAGEKERRGARDGSAPRLRRYRPNHRPPQYGSRSWLRAGAQELWRRGGESSGHGTFSGL